LEANIIELWIYKRGQDWFDNDGSKRDRDIEDINRE